MRIVVREKHRTEPKTIPHTAIPHTAIRAWVVGARNRRKRRAVKLETLHQALDRLLAGGCRLTDIDVLTQWNA